MIAMLRRPEGATVDEVARATGLSAGGRRIRTLGPTCERDAERPRILRVRSSRLSNGQASCSRWRCSHFDIRASADRGRPAFGKRRGAGRVRPQARGCGVRVSLRPYCRLALPQPASRRCCSFASKPMPGGISAICRIRTGTELRHQCRRLETLGVGGARSPPSNSSIRSGVNGRLISATPRASATALAMQTGVLIASPS